LRECRLAFRKPTNVPYNINNRSSSDNCLAGEERGKYKEKKNPVKNQAEPAEQCCMFRAGGSTGLRLAVLTSGGRLNMHDSAVTSSAVPPLRPNYATEGGSVPVYSMLHGRVQRRNWVLHNPQWCDLCKEPVAQWVNHMGRKDHALMDMHYTCMMEWQRRWNPEHLIQAFQEHLGIDSIEPLHRLFSLEDQHGRNEIYAMLVKLEEAGMLSFGETRDTYLHMMLGGLRGMDQQGALVLHECLFKPFVHLYPDAHIQDYSNLVDFITCGYNMETVYDLCGMYTLDKLALKAQFGPTSPAAMGLGGIATSSSASFGYRNESTAASCTAAAATTTTAPVNPKAAQAQVAKARREQENMEEEAFSRKAAFMRQILGQLRWLLMPTQVHPAGYTFPEHIITLGEICLKALVVQIVASRVVEYTVRVEPVWHSFGFERRKRSVAEIAKARDDIVPRLFRYTHHTVMPSITELYSSSSTALDDYVAKGLHKKGLPVPKEFQKPIKASVCDDPRSRAA
jgi:hypothetical protein